MHFMQMEFIFFTMHDYFYLSLRSFFFAYGNSRFFLALIMKKKNWHIDFSQLNSDVCAVWHGIKRERKG